MATKRRRGDSWQYTIKRAGLLPQPVYLSFASEAEGDEYVRRLEALLDRGVVPEELANTKAAAKDLRSQVSEYRSAQHISVDDEQLLPVLLSRLPIGITLPQLTFTWATEWVTTMKREQNLAPSTIRHYVGALSRALDWLAAHGALPMNPLRLLPRGYSTYTADDKVAVKRIDGDRLHSAELVALGIPDRQRPAAVRQQRRSIIGHGQDRHPLHPQRLLAWQLLSLSCNTQLTTGELRACLKEANLQVLHQEADYITVRATAEAVIEAFDFVDGEARRRLIMERT